MLMIAVYCILPAGAVTPLTENKQQNPNQKQARQNQSNKKLTKKLNQLKFLI